MELGIEAELSKLSKRFSIITYNKIKDSLDLAIRESPDPGLQVNT
jgi:hypothetical protein